MSKTSITYIGPKEVKKDTVTNSRFVFPRLQPVEVDTDLANILLQYKTVWVLSEEAEDIVAEKEKHDQAVAKKLAQEQEQAKKTNLDESMLVIANGDELDISKYSSKQLETLAIASDLVITTKVKPVAPYREAVRDALRELNGTPDQE